MAKPDTQDTSDWALDKINRFEDYAHANTEVTIDGNDAMGVWMLLNQGYKENYFSQWVPVEVAEAMGTMLLYAAQKWRENHEQG